MYLFLVNMQKMLAGIQIKGLDILEVTHMFKRYTVHT